MWGACLVVSEGMKTVSRSCVKGSQTLLKGVVKGSTPFKKGLATSLIISLQTYNNINCDVPSKEYNTCITDIYMYINCDTMSLQKYKQVPI